MKHRKPGTFLGVDIGATAVRVAGPSRVAVRPVPAGAVVDGTVKDPGAVAEALHTAWKDLGTRARGVAVAVNTELTWTARTHLPAQDRADLVRNLPALTAEQHLLPVDAQTVVVDYLPLGAQDEDGLPALVVGVDREVVTTLATTLELAGLTMVGADLGILAALRTVTAHGLLTADAGGLAVVDCGADLTGLAVLHEGRIRAVEVHTGAGGARATATVLKFTTQPAGARWDDALAQEAKHAPDAASAPAVDRAGRAIAEQIAGWVTGAAAREAVPVGGVTLIGGGARLLGLPERLAERLGVPVHVAPTDLDAVTAQGMTTAEAIR